MENINVLNREDNNNMDFCQKNNLIKGIKDDIMSDVRKEFLTTQIPTGIKAFDKEIDGGICKDTITLVAGREKSGKYEILKEMAVNIANSGRRVMYITTLEKSTDESIKEELSAIVTRKGLEPSVLNNIVAYSKRDLDITTLCVMVGIEENNRGLDAIIIDDDKVIMNNKALSKKIDKVSYSNIVSDELCKLSKVLNINVFIGVRVVKRCDSKGYIPKHNDLKDASRLNQVAHLLVSTYKDDVYNDSTDKTGEISIHIIKNRGGGRGNTFNVKL